MGVLDGLRWLGRHHRRALREERAGSATTSPEVKKKLLALDSTFSSVNNPIDQMANYGDQYKTCDACSTIPRSISSSCARAAGRASFWANASSRPRPRPTSRSSSTGPRCPDACTRCSEQLEHAGFLCALYASRLRARLAVFTDFALRRAAFANAEEAPGPVEPHSRWTSGRRQGTLCRAPLEAMPRAIRHPDDARSLLQPRDRRAGVGDAPCRSVAVKLAVARHPAQDRSRRGAARRESLDELKRSGREVHESGLQHTPSARVDGISIQEMASGRVILGAVNEAGFRTYVMVGLGGVLPKCCRMSRTASRR